MTGGRNHPGGNHPDPLYTITRRPTIIKSVIQVSILWKPYAFIFSKNIVVSYSPMVVGVGADGVVVVVVVIVGLVLVVEVVELVDGVVGVVEVSVVVRPPTIHVNRFSSS